MNQSDSAYCFGLIPLGCSHCVFPFASICSLSSSVYKPKYKSCCLYDACRVANSQVAATLFNSVTYSVAFDRIIPLLDTSLTVHLRSTLISISDNLIGLPFPKRSAPLLVPTFRRELFTKAPLGNLFPLPEQRERWFYLQMYPPSYIQHAELFVLPMFCFSTHYVFVADFVFRILSAETTFTSALYTSNIALFGNNT